MADRLTFYPAAIASADPLVLDAALESAIRLLWLHGTDPLVLTPITAKGPGQVGETALDVMVPSRVVGAQALVDTDDLDALYDVRSNIARAMVGIPVRPGESLELGRLLLERDGHADVEIYALPRTAPIDWLKAPHKGMIDAEWLCPYPHFQDTADSTLSVPDATAVTGVAATNLITATDHDLSIGDAVVFTSLTGGAGLTVGVTYYVLSGSFTSSTFKVGTSGSPVSEVNFTTDISAGTIARLSTAANVGDVDAPFVAVIHGPATAITLTNLTSGEVVTVTVALSSSEWLEIDTTPGVKTVRKYTAVDTWTNAIAGLSLVDYRLWLLRPGNNSVRLVVTGSGANTLATLTWRNRYNGL